MLAEALSGPHVQLHDKVQGLLMAVAEEGVRLEADPNQPGRAPPLQSGRNRARRT